MTTPATNEGATATPATADPAATATPASATPADTDAASNDGQVAATLLTAQADGGEGQGAAATDPGADWLPEKFRVNGEDGALDEAASARKLAESYKALEAHKGPLPQAPATPEDYTLAAPEGADAEGFAAFTGDELFKGFAKDAHALGMTNEQLQFVTERYLKLAPELMAADQSLTADAAKAELAKVWTDDKAMADNLSNVVRAINGFGAQADDVPGSRSRLMEKYGTDPDFIAFAASVAKEMGEDKLPAATSMARGEDVEALQASEAYWKPEHPDHARVKRQVSEYYARKHGTQPRRGGIVAA